MMNQSDEIHALHAAGALMHHARGIQGILRHHMAYHEDAHGIRKEHKRC